MTYRQYTKCISRGNYHGGAVAQVLAGAALGALPLLFGAAAAPGVALILLGMIIAYCRWWLYGRLICLGGDVCAVGMVLIVEPPSEKSGLDAFDTDYSFSMVLPPHRVGATQAEVQDDGIQGNLVKQQAETSGLDFEGKLDREWGNDPETATLHCEFEGGGVYDLLLAALAALAALGVAAAAAVLCAAGLIGWIACLVLSLIAAAIVVGGAIGALNDQGNPDDLGTHLGEIHKNDPTGRGADILVVRGTWVYDSAHQGWNEIHPIKQCQRIGTWEGSWTEAGFPPGHEKEAVASWCEALGKASDPLTVEEQSKPQHRWVIHPSIDGCQPAGEPAPEEPHIA